MSGESKVVPLHEVERLIKQLEKTVRSAKCRAARQLETIPVFPSLISSADQFLHEVVTPILTHLSSDTEGVRQSCVNTLSNYADQLGAENLNETLNYMLPPIFQRLNVEEAEPAEEIRLSLMNLLLKLIQMVTKETVPNHIETKVMDDIATPLAVAFKNQNSDMKKCACQVLNAIMDRCEKEALAGIAPQLITVMIPNCVHRHNEVRKLTIQSLGRLYAMSSVTDDLEKVADLTQRLIDDTNAAVRKCVIKFIEILLTEHQDRAKIYFPMMIPLFSKVMPLVPLRRVDVEIEPKAEKMNDDPVVAFEALTHIGRVYEADKEMKVEESDGVMFDDTRKVCPGLAEIIKENYGKFLDKMLPMIVDWTDQNKKYGFAAIRTIVQLGRELSASHIQSIFLKMAQSLHEQRNDEMSALQTAAIVSSFVSGEEIVNFLLPKVTNEGPKDVIQLLAVALTNSPVTDDVLTNILTHFMNVKVYEALTCIEPLVQLLLAIVKRSQGFANTHATEVLIFLLKLCEHTDALKCFVDSFGRPLADIFAENMSTLLQSDEKTPQYITHILLTSPVEAVSANQEVVCKAIMDCLDTDAAGKTKTEKLIVELCNRKAFTHLTKEFIEKVKDDMVWAPGKEKVPYREQSTYAMSAMIRNHCIDDETLSDIENILPILLSSYDDTWADCVRVAGTEAMKEFIKRSTNDNTEFEKIYPAIKERLDDHLLSIRADSAIMMGDYFVKCTDNSSIPEKWDEIMIFIDDESEQMRNAIAQFCRTVGQVPAWKDGIITVLAAQQNVHEESNVLCQQLIDELR